MQNRHRPDSTEVIRAEVAVIQKMLDDETWYEGERRHNFVDPHDPVVLEHVLDICVRAGREILAETEKKIADSGESAG